MPLAAFASAEEPQRPPPGYGIETQLPNYLPKEKVLVTGDLLVIAGGRPAPTQVDQ